MINTASKVIEYRRDPQNSIIDWISKQRWQMKILLLQASTSKRMIGFSSMFTPEPLALEAIAAMVPEHETKIVDLRVDERPVEDILAGFLPDVVGLTGYTTGVQHMLDTCARIKSFSPHVVTVCG